MMQELSGTYYSTSEQHKEMSEARRIRDKNNTDVLLEFQTQHAIEMKIRNVFMPTPEINKHSLTCSEKDFRQMKSERYMQTGMQIS